VDKLLTFLLPLLLSVSLFTYSPSRTFPPSLPPPPFSSYISNTPELRGISPLGSSATKKTIVKICRGQVCRLSELIYDVMLHDREEILTPYSPTIHRRFLTSQCSGSLCCAHHRALPSVFKPNVGSFEHSLVSHSLLFVCRTCVSVSSTSHVHTSNSSSILLSRKSPCCCQDFHSRFSAAPRTPHDAIKEYDKTQNDGACMYMAHVCVWCHIHIPLT
jgi:hypothetical protein